MAANTDDALRALQGRDWNGGEADRRGVNRSVVIRDAVAAARAAATADEPITVTRGDLHRLIDRFPAA